MRARARQSAGPPKRGDETGGAVSLLVMLMVPVCVLAAVVAAAVPRRIAAQASADSAASNLASLAAGWRDVQGRDHGRIGWFPPDCGPAPDRAGGQAAEALGADLQSACETLARSLLADLGARGFDESDITGFYSSAYTTSTGSATQGDAHPASLPCRAGGRAVIADAAHVALAADWGARDWATAHVWPDGITIRSEAIGRITQPAGDDNTGPPDCGGLLDATLLEGLPRLSDEALSFAETLPTRTAFGN
ncbi:hypothetical protein [Candidatus Poriferisodalis sp.]|uniref:hypothetical protein n=1 Tax=Candidatus Poriferisodalis sp. TaxID=3101277 RepID=UPI003B02D95E